MSFNSIPFLLCLPLVVALSAVLAHRVHIQNLFLLCCSLAFYGYWDWRFLGLLIATVGVDYLMGLAISAAVGPASRRAWLGISLVTNLGILGLFKYYDFFAGSLESLLAAIGMPVSLPLLQILLPIGLSFYVFQSMSYTLDVYRGRMPPIRSLLDFALFVTFFPQLVAGPIERAEALLPQLQRPKRASFIQLREGAYLVLYGLFQKIAIGDAAGSLVDYVYANPFKSGWIQLLAGTAAFSMQIYGDFAGYSNIARGCAKLLGVELMLNFANPYLSKSVTEFWRRWHISLSTWLRDYLYLPLGGNRAGRLRESLNILIVMLLGGLWHGASWTFVIWGGLHGLYLVAHKHILRHWPSRAGGAVAPLSTLLKTIGIFALVSLTWVFFRAPSLEVAASYLGGILSLQEGEWEPITYQIGVVACFMIPLELLAWRSGSETTPLRWPWFLRGPFYAFLIWSILGGLGAKRAFVYFQF